MVILVHWQFPTGFINQVQSHLYTAPHDAEDELHTLLSCDYCDNNDDYRDDNDDKERRNIIAVNLIS